jgi:hypothetical protein
VLLLRLTAGACSAASRAWPAACRDDSRRGGREAAAGRDLRGIGVSAAAAVSLLGLDRLPLSLCALKVVTGIPCPTCGTTRALACLAHLDLAGAFAMKPARVFGRVPDRGVAASDLALLPFRRALVVEMSAVPASVLRAVAVTASSPTGSTWWRSGARKLRSRPRAVVILHRAW